MSDKKISQLDPAAALDGTELLAVVQNTNTLRSTVSAVKTYLDTFYQPLDADLTAIAALGYASTSFLKKTGANTWALDTNTYQVSNANLTSLAALNYVSGAFVKMTAANTFSLDTSTYLTTVDAASTYVPLTRELTINGVTYDLSANRSWTVSVAAEDLATTLAAGNTSGAYDILMNTTQRVGFKDGDNINTSYISNNQTTAGSRTAYLPLFTGQLAYHATGVPLTQNYVVKAGANGILSSSTVLYDDGSKIGVGTNTPQTTLDVQRNTANNTETAIFQNQGNGASSLTSIGIYNNSSNGIILGVTASSNTATSTYGTAQSGYLYNGASCPEFHFINGALQGWYFHHGGASTTPVLSLVDNKVGANILAPTATVHSKGSTSDSTAYALKVDNSSSSALLYVRNDGNIGVGTNSPSYFVTIEKNVNDFPYHLVIANNSAGTSAASSLRINTDVNGMEFGVLNSGNTVYSTYGGANDAFLRYNPSVSYQGNVNFLLSPNASTTKAFRFFVSQNAGSNYRLAIDKDGVLVKGSTSDSTTHSFISADSSGFETVRFRNDGFKNFRINQNDLLGIRNENTNAGNSAGALMNFVVASTANMEIGVVNGTAWTAYATGANDSFIANGLGAGALNIVHRNAGRILFWTGNAPGSSNIAAISINSAQNIGMSVDYTAIGARLHIKGSTSDSSAYYLKGDDSSSAARFYGRNDGAHAINSSSLVSTAALKIKGRLIVSTQEVTSNDSYNAMIEVGVGNGVLFSDGTSGATANNRLGYIFGDGGLQIYGRNNASATKFFFSGKASANRYEFYSDDANTHLRMTSTGVINYTHAVNNDGFNVIRSNAATTTASAYSAISVINADATANRVSVIGFTYQANVARSGFIAARFIDNTNGDLLLGNKKSGTEQTVVELTANGNQIMGTQAALATNATDGFLYVPSCAGTPTGTPTAYTGKIAVVADSTNNKLYIYSGGAWVALN